MSTLCIHLFGGFRIGFDRRDANVSIGRTTQALLAYLVVYRQRTHPRDVLTALFWSDYDEAHARNALNTSLWRLRRALEERAVTPAAYLLSTPDREVRFNPDSDYWLDLAEFENSVQTTLVRPAPALQTGEVERLEQATALYTGDLLEGFYDNWAIRERERVRLVYLASLAHLMAYYQHAGAVEEGLAYGRQILALDPLREQVHRDMMCLYARSGQRALAVRQYHTCREVLADELGIPPADETNALYREIAGANGDASTLTDGQGGGMTDVAWALSQLRVAVEHSARAQGQLARAMQLVQRALAAQTAHDGNQRARTR